MAKRKNGANSKDGKAESFKKLRFWTILCLVIVCIAAIALRGYIVYRMYPLNYKAEIKISSAEYKLDPYFVSAVICAESHFNKDAVSHTGAIGLMQIMPDTGAWAAKKMGMKDFSADMLTDPKTNISIGCWYLSYLSKLFDGDAKKMLAAYNAGPAKVQEWINDGKMDDIPYKDTENYLKIVEKNYDIYKGLYADF